MWYARFIMNNAKLRRVDEIINIGASHPGNINDRKRGFERFLRWSKLPKTAHKLYWRMKDNKNDGI